MRMSSFTAAWRSQGTWGALQVAKDMLLGTTSALAIEVAHFDENVRGIEIGGPSSCFRRRGFLPIYPRIPQLDIVNFSSQTLWEGTLTEGAPFAPEKRTLGIQLVREATDLKGIDDGTYDVVLSSHCLEHCADALRALKEWRRICTPDGLLCLVLPHRDGTFDWQRPVTTLDHYRQDREDAVGEDDQTHFDEIIRLHDISRDSGLRSREELRTRVSGNLQSRAVHHHVFDLHSALSLVRESGWSPIASEARRPYDIVVLARNLTTPAHDPDLSALVGPSPFPSDR